MKKKSMVRVASSRMVKSYRKIFTIPEMNSRIDVLRRKRWRLNSDQTRTPMDETIRMSEKGSLWLNASISCPIPREGLRANWFALNRIEILSYSVKRIRMMISRP